MLKRWFSSLAVRYPKAVAYLTGELPLLSVAPLYQSNLAPSELLPEVGVGIPCDVYQTWTQPMLGKSHAAAIERFTVLNPGYRFWFYDSDDMDAYMRDFYVAHPIYEIYKSAQFGPVKTDIWRYCILLERGGWYFDINKMVEAPLGQIASAEDTAVISYERNLLPEWMPLGPKTLKQPDRLILNWGLGFSRGHPVLRAVVDNIVRDYPKFKGVRFPNVKEAVLRLTGPHQLTSTIHQLAREGGLALREAGIDFDGFGNADINGSWVRYAAQQSYSRQSDGIIVH